MGAMSSQITGVSIVCATVCWNTNKKPIKAARHRPSEGNSPVTSGFLSQRASNAENVSILWRHQDHIKIKHDLWRRQKTKTHLLFKENISGETVKIHIMRLSGVKHEIKTIVRSKQRQFLPLTCHIVGARGSATNCKYTHNFPCILFKLGEDISCSRCSQFFLSHLDIWEFVLSTTVTINRGGVFLIAKKTLNTQFSKMFSIKKCGDCFVFGLTLSACKFQGTVYALTLVDCHGSFSYWRHFLLQNIR